MRGPVHERSSRRHRESARFVRGARALGLQVRTLRLQRQWTLEQAAERMDLDLKHLQKVEAGTLNVTLVTLSRIAEGLGTSLAELFLREPTKQEARVVARPSGKAGRRPSGRTR